MAISSGINAKTIDELQELGKLTGLEKTVISADNETKKVSIDTIIGYAAAILANNNTPALMSLNTRGSQGFVIVPEGEEIPVSERTPGCFYLERTKQTSIRTKVDVPTSVTVSGTLALRRL